jgi:hypothetical protein
MSLLAELADEFLQDSTVRAALERYRQDPNLSEYDVLVALVKVLSKQKRDIEKQIIDMHKKDVRPIRLETP